MFKTIIATIAATVAVADPVVLDGSNFKSLVWDGEKTNKDTNGNGWFVKFYAPWCTTAELWHPSGRNSPISGVTR